MFTGLENTPKVQMTLCAAKVNNAKEMKHLALGEGRSFELRRSFGASCIEKSVDYYVK